jgi:5-methyltetrahydropteroyltriglutamate--homocysteine methyltransferase
MLHQSGDGKEATPLDLLDAVLPVYQELLRLLGAKHVAWVQIDEPCLVLDLGERARGAYRRTFERLAAGTSRPRILVAPYFGALGDNLPLVAVPGLDGLHVDLVRAPEQVEAVLAGLGPQTLLSVGVVDGRNVWRADLDGAHGLVRRAVSALGAERVLVAPSCSLLHVPVDLAAEREIDPDIKKWFAFAAQKIDEVRALADAAEMETARGRRFDEARVSLANRRASPRTSNPEVRTRVAAVNEAMLHRSAPFDVRVRQQRARFNLPIFPTTTIGSFPQTAATSDQRRNAEAARAGGRCASAGPAVGESGLWAQDARLA